MGMLAAYVFGPVRLTDRERGTDILLQPTPKRLIGFLVLNRGRVMQRDAVTEALWPDHDPASARRCLNSTLFRLRQAVAAHGALLPVATPSSEEIVLTTGPEMWCDLSTFEVEMSSVTASGETDTRLDVAALERAATLYTGPLLDGIDDDWAARRRQGAETTYLDLLHRLLIGQSQLNNWKAAVAYGRQILAIDPLREDVHSDVMRALNAGGNRTQALRQYEELKQVLRLELEIPPMPETEALYHEICAGGTMGDRPAAATVRPMPSLKPFGAGVKSLHLRVRRLQEAARTLQADIDEIVRLSEAIDASHAAPVTVGE